MRKLIYFAVMAILLASCQQKQEQVAVEEPETLDIPECVVTTPPDSLHLDPFYKKYVDVNGLDGELWHSYRHHGTL